MIESLKKIREMKAYLPPLETREKFDGLRLDFNERLSPLPASVVQALQNFDPQRCLTYPSYGALPAKIAEYAGVKEDQVMITNGSDQGMELIFRTFVNEGAEVLIPSPSFAMFYQVAGVEGAKVTKVAYEQDGAFPFKAILGRANDAKKPCLLIVCNPNNPTGTLISVEEIESILQAMPDTIVYVDEAYFEFSGITATGLVEKYSNLIITRTFSKAFGLAGLRIGYTISNSKNIDEMLKVRGPYDVNQVAKVMAEASLNTNPSEYCNEVMLKAKPLVEAFFTKSGVEFFKSGSNYIYFKEPYAGFSQDLRENGILIRPQADQFARVTIGTVKQMEKFISISKNLITKI